MMKLPAASGQGAKNVINRLLPKTNLFPPLNYQSKFHPYLTEQVCRSVVSEQKILKESTFYPISLLLVKLQIYIIVFRYDLNFICKVDSDFFLSEKPLKFTTHVPKVLR